MAHREVLKSVANEIDQDFRRTDHETQVGTKQQVGRPKRVRASKPSSTTNSMRRSGRAPCNVNYREDSDPIETASGSDEDLGADQATARRQASRQQHKQPRQKTAQFDIDFSDDGQGGAALRAGGMQQPKQQTAAVTSGDGAGSAETEDGESDDGQADSDSDFQQPRKRASSKHQAADSRAASRRAAAIVSSDDDGPSDDAVQEQSVSEEEEEEQQEQRNTRAAVAAASGGGGGRYGSRRVAHKQHPPPPAVVAPRRSRRVAAAAAEAAEEDPEPVRPRRAAAAAAKAATAALLSEQHELRFTASPGSASDDDDDDADSDALGSRGASDVEDEVILLEDDSSGGAEDDADSSEDEEQASDISGDSGRGRKQRGLAAAAAAAGRLLRPRRHRGGSSTGGSGAGSESDQAEGEGVDDAQENQVLDLNTFRFGNAKAPADTAARGKAAAAGGSGRSSPAAGSDEDAAAAGGGGRARGNSRSGRTSPAAGGGASPKLSAKAAAAAAAEATEADAGDVLEPEAFAPRDVQKLPRKDEIEKILSTRYEEDGGMQVLLKLVGKSYRDAVWVPSKQVEAKGKSQLLRNFLAKQSAGEEPGVTIDPRWYQVERIIEDWRHRSGEHDYLVKWCGLEYVDCTWETEEEVTRDGAGRAALARFKLWTVPPPGAPRPPKRPSAELVKQQLLPKFRNGRALRDYQETSLHWMINNYRGEMRNSRWWPRNCILGDEMGLGKTAQSISVMAWLRQYGGVASPFMVVAPLTTLHHWKREIETWTGMNVVLYTGSQRDRELIRETEFYYPQDKNRKTPVLGPRFDVLLVSYETVLRDRTELKKISYEVLILDEAHRLKTRTSSTRAALLELPVHWWLLLSGTPVQNNMRELQGLMSVLDEEAYGDLDDFLERFGDAKPSLQQIKALQAALAPVLLRRMKEDVEDLPEKEEVVIWVELTAEQRRYYRALYSKQIGHLLQGVAAKNLPGMRNLAMELRKLCCHPFLCDGLEEDMAVRWAQAQAAGASGAANKEVEALTRASGKMLLLHKLLHKLRSEGRQVLIFSQFKMMLDVLEDYLAACDYPYERIDGDTNHKDRQAAIDRFMATKKSGSSRSTPQPTGAASGGSSREGSVDKGRAEPAGGAEGGPFVFLLSTRAGGQGITLTSADTVIIYDSDWNPQNDLQAMARCHRIGQDREVTVYRLVSKDTYEQQLFECASRKYGLDEAILGFAGAGDNPEQDAARIEQLLRRGAHAIAGDVDAAGEHGEDKGMAAEDIQQILAGRSEKRQLGSRKGNTFSIAHFGAGGAEPELPEPEEVEQQQPVDARAFWSELLPDAVAAHAAAHAAAKEPQVLGPRRRTLVNYREKGYARFESDDEEEDGQPASKRAAKRAAADADDFDANKEEAEADDDLQGQHCKKKHKSKAAAEGGPVDDPELGRVVQPWTGDQVAAAWAETLRFGPDRIDRIVDSLDKLGVPRPADEVQQLARALVLLLTELDKLPEVKSPPKPAAAAAAGGQGTDLTAAAGPSREEELAARAARHGSLPAHTVTALRDGLAKAGLPDKLPPACRKALLSSSLLQRLGRNPHTLLQQLQEHQQVHALMVKAGYAQHSKSAIGEATPSKQPADGAAKAGTPAAAGSGGEVKSPGKRCKVVPRVSLKGFKQLPTWWSRDHDERLVLGCYNCGYGSYRMHSTVEGILEDPAYGFAQEVALDPVAALQHAAAAQQPPATAGDQAAAAPACSNSISPQQLEQAKAEKQALLAAASRPNDLLWMGPADWKKFVSTVVARLKKVRACMLDPNFVEPPKGCTPCKPNDQPQLQLNKTPASTAGQAVAAAAAAGGRPAGSQVKLCFTPVQVVVAPVALAGKVGVTLAAAAQQQAAMQRAVLQQKQQRAVLQQQQQRAVLQQQQQRAVLQQQQQQQQLRAVLQHQQHQQLAAAAAAAKQVADAKAAAAAKAAGAAAPAARPAAHSVKRPTPDSGIVVVDDEDDFMPARHKPATTSGTAAAPAAKRPKAAAARREPDQGCDVVDLASQEDTPQPEDAAAQPAAAGGVKPLQQQQQQQKKAAASSAAAAPSTGVVVRHVPAAELSDGRSMEVDEPGVAGESGTPASGAEKLNSTGRQQMQQLLGSSERAGGDGAAAGDTPSQPHPVYGTPASEAAATAAKRGKLAKGKEDGKQRKIGEFFTKRPSGGAGAP